jgi:hypothetical protein
VSIQAITKTLRPYGHQTGRLRLDRILNEAQHTNDPLHPIRRTAVLPTAPDTSERADQAGSTSVNPA